MPWQALIALIEPCYRKASKKDDKLPFPLATMLRIHLLQHWDSLSDAFAGASGPLLGEQASLTAVGSQLGGAEPGGHQHHRELVRGAPTLGFFLGGLHHLPQHPPALAPLVDGDHMDAQLLGNLRHALA